MAGTRDFVGMEEFYYSGGGGYGEHLRVCVCEAVGITDKFCFLKCFSALSFWCVYVREAVAITEKFGFLECFSVL